MQRFSRDDFVILLLYVEDMLIVDKNASRIDRLKKQLSEFFTMKDLRPKKQILGMRITRHVHVRKLFLSQEKYIEKVLHSFNMDKAKVVNSPLATHFRLSTNQSLSIDKEKEEMERVSYVFAIGSLMYVMVCNCLDIGYVVGTVSRFLSNRGNEHWNAVKWIMRYLRGTSSMSLYFGCKKPELFGYIDVDIVDPSFCPFSTCNASFYPLFPFYLVIVPW